MLNKYLFYWSPDHFTYNQREIVTWMMFYYVLSINIFISIIFIICTNALIHVSCKTICIITGMHNLRATHWVRATAMWWTSRILMQLHHFTNLSTSIYNFSLDVYTYECTKL